MSTTSTYQTKVQVAPADLTIFLNSCERIGVQPSDFGTIIRSIANHVINGMKENESASRLKKVLLFLSIIEVFLNSIRIN